MKTKSWILLLIGLLLLCLLLSIPMLRSQGGAAYAQVLSQGTVVQTVDLSKDQVFTVFTPSGGENTITVQGGRIAVTEANCPDHYCIARGFCSSGQVVCLPNRLVIRFIHGAPLDAISG